MCCEVEIPKLSKRQREVLIGVIAGTEWAVPYGARGVPFRKLQDLGLIRIGMAGGFGSGTHYRPTLTAEGERVAAAL